MSDATRGMMLSELLLAFGLLAVSILALLGLSISAMKAGRKSSQGMEATQVGVRQLALTTHEAAGDSDFWLQDYSTSPYRTGTVKVGKTDYTFEVYSETLFDSVNARELGSGVPGNRVKKMDVVVSWMGRDPKSGYGKRTVRQSCLVKEGGS